MNEKKLKVELEFWNNKGEYGCYFRRGEDVIEWKDMTLEEHKNVAEAMEILGKTFNYYVKKGSEVGE